MQFQPYLMFDGTCAEAMRFYERVIGGKLEPLLGQQLKYLIELEQKFTTAWIAARW